MHKANLATEVSLCFQTVSNLLSRKGHARWSKGNTESFKAKVLDSKSKGVGKRYIKEMYYM